MFTSVSLKTAIAQTLLLAGINLSEGVCRCNIENFVLHLGEPMLRESTAILYRKEIPRESLKVKSHSTF